MTPSSNPFVETPMMQTLPQQTFFGRKSMNFLSTIVDRFVPRARLAILALATAALLPVVSAQAAAQLTDQDKQDIARIEQYFNNIKTLQARFIQLSPNGRFAQGNLYINRPGKLRFEYDEPVPYLLIADGNQVIFYDKKLNTPSYIPLSATPLEFLLAPQVKLTNGVIVQEIARDPGVIRVTLQQKGKEADGAVQITFSDRPFAVKKWTLIDKQGQAIHVAILEPKFDLDLDPKLFQFKNPKIYKDGAGSN